MKTGITWLAVIAQSAAAILWLVSTLVKVTAAEAERAYRRETGSSGGQAAIILDFGDGASQVDFIQTAARQAKWNRWAAGTTAAGMALQAIATALPGA